MNYIPLIGFQRCSVPIIGTPRYFCHVLWSVLTNYVQLTITANQTRESQK